jgi:hypothetical protein
MENVTPAEFDPLTGELFPDIVPVSAYIAERIAEPAAPPAPASQRAAETVANPNPQPLGGRSLDEALFLVQSELPFWIKAEATGQAGPRRFKYATLASILAIVRPALEKHGIRLRQGADKSWPMDEGGGVKGRLIPVWTELVHVPSGERERVTLEMPLPKMDPQGMGSAVTFGRRYSLLAALGLASDEADDDGARAQRHDVTAQHEESAELISLKAEVDKIADVPALVKWGTDSKIKRAVDDLDEAEAVLLRQHWARRKAALSTEGEQPAPAEAPAAPAKRKPKTEG